MNYSMSGKMDDDYEYMTFDPEMEFVLGEYKDGELRDKEITCQERFWIIILKTIIRKTIS